MASIDKLNALLTNRFSDKRSKIPSEVQPKENLQQNSFMLFYNNENTTLAAGIRTEDAFYSTGVQIAVKHTDFDKARDLCFKAHKFLHANKRTEAGVWWIPLDTPIFLGRDTKGSNVFAFNINMSGDE